MQAQLIMCEYCEHFPAECERWLVTSDPARHMSLCLPCALFLDERNATRDEQPDDTDDEDNLSEMG